jgi:mitochondrial chaperone BCS1
MASLLPKDGEFLSLSWVYQFLLSRLIRFAFSLLFATTNHIERLDPALSRPGRMDVWINFKNATKWQAEGIFKNFFPCKSLEPPTPSTSQEGAVGRKGRSRRKVDAPVLDEDELADLAKRFADAVPEDELSVGFGLVMGILQAGLTDLFRSPPSKDTSSRTRLDRRKR